MPGDVTGRSAASGTIGGSGAGPQVTRAVSHTRCQRTLRKVPVMAALTAVSPEQAADRLAIRELVDAYAHCADRRDAKGQMALFTEDTRFLVFMDPASAEPAQELHGRESLAPVFGNLNVYAATMH